ncbi:hypothetical protein VMCG_03378 [Cytospora schulzeri]|uniref:Uncharacterized protein n=1 Tax=Cytospora schulzeri TaxID=448051 RepID=A0A423WWF1_9PEZI|nr:hypothetical protein VMCG_03378 [Valsa malicola]
MDDIIFTDLDADSLIAITVMPTLRNELRPHLPHPLLKNYDTAGVAKQALLMQMQDEAHGDNNLAPPTSVSSAGD